MNEPTRSPSYRRTVRWIATQSGAEKLSYPELLSLSAVLLTSAQFGLDACDVASDVARAIEITNASGRRPDWSGLRAEPGQA